MTTTKAIYEMEKEIPENYETDPQYLKYERLLDQYFEIKNDEERWQAKFNEITTQHQSLVQSGIIVIWWGKRMSKNKSQKELKFKLFGILFSKQKGNIYLKFEKPMVLRGN